MNREITSKEEKLLTKGKETTIKTNIEHLKTYNEKIIKENIFLEITKDIDTKKPSQSNIRIIQHRTLQCRNKQW